MQYCQQIHVGVEEIYLWYTKGFFGRKRFDSVLPWTSVFCPNLSHVFRNFSRMRICHHSTTIKLGVKIFFSFASYFLFSSFLFRVQYLGP